VSSIDWVVLSKIGVGALLAFILSTISAWFLDRRQTKREREWQKRREQKLLRQQKLEEQQSVLKRLFHDLQVGFRLNPLFSEVLDIRLNQGAFTKGDVLSKDAFRQVEQEFFPDLYSELKSRMIKVAENMSAFDLIEFPHDEQLIRLLREYAETQGELVNELNELIEELRSVLNLLQGIQLPDNPEDLSEEELWAHVEEITPILKAARIIHRKKQELDTKAAGVLGELGRRIDQRFEELKAQNFGRDEVEP